MPLELLLPALSPPGQKHASLAIAQEASCLGASGQVSGLPESPICMLLHRPPAYIHSVHMIIYVATDQNHVPRVHVPMPSDPEGLDRILDPEGVER